MTQQQTFRTAFNGFHREDVVRYIEELNTKHAAEISQLRSEIQYLQDKLTQYETLESADTAAPELEQKVEEQATCIAELEKQLAEALTTTAAPAPVEDDTASDLEQRVEEQAAALLANADRISELEQQLAEAKSNVQTAEALLEESEAENSRLQGLLDTALARQAGIQTQQETELSIYRRAERVEREANARAAQIHEQANGALADATARVDDVATQIAAMTNDTLLQLKQLQLAVTGSKQVLQDAAATLYAIRPAAEE